MEIIDYHNLQTLIDITTSPVWLADTDCRIKLCNSAFKKWIYYFTGKELDAGDYLLSEEFGRFYLDKFEPCYPLALSGQSLTVVEDMIVEGTRKYTTVNFNPVYNKQNVVTGISCHAIDITEQRIQLIKINEQANTLIDIAHIQSHKVRGPVASILGLAQLFNFDDLTDPDNREVMKGIVSSTEHLDEMVKEVITKINRLSNRKNTQNMRF